MVVNKTIVSLLGIILGLFLLPAFLIADVSSDHQATVESFIQSPSVCSTVLSVEGDTINLKTPETCDTSGSGMIYVDLPTSIEEFRVFNNGKYWKVHKQANIDRRAIEKVREGSKEVEEDLKLRGVSPEFNKHNQQAAEIAGEASKYIYSEAFQSKINAENERLKLEVFADTLKGTEVDPEKKGSPGAPQLKYLNEDERIYIFVSKSVPIETVRTYVKLLDKLQEPLAIMTMRGFVGGATTVKPTMDYMGSLFSKDPNCNPVENVDKECETYRIESQIDPLVFRRYNITKVPAVVFATGVNKIGGQVGGSEGIDEDFQIGKWWSVDGDAGIDYMLEKINNEAKNENLAKVVKKMREGFYR